MGRRRWHRFVIAACVGLAGLALCLHGARAAKLPDSVVGDVQQLAESLSRASMARSEFGSGEMAVERGESRELIGRILRNAGASEANRKALAAYLLTDLEALGKRFRRGTPNEASLLTKRKWLQGEAPWENSATEAYLLLELAKRAKSPEFTSRALAAICGAEQAISYFFECKTRHAGPDHAALVAREIKQTGGYGTSMGAEIAWCCERFMIDSRLADSYATLPKARAVVDGYWRWRYGANGPTRDYRPIGCEHGTMKFARRLAEALVTK